MTETNVSHTDLLARTHGSPLERSESMHNKMDGRKLMRIHIFLS